MKTNNSRVIRFLFLKGFYCYFSLIFKLIEAEYYEKPEQDLSLFVSCNRLYGYLPTLFLSGNAG